MLPAQRNKIDISKLTPEQQTAFRLYGKLPANAKSLAKKPAPRQYFDSGDYAMSKSGKPTEQPLGTEHPSPETIPHASNGNLSGIPIPSPSPSIGIPGSGSSPTGSGNSSSSSSSPVNQLSTSAGANTAASALSPGKASPPGLTSVGVASLPSPASVQPHPNSHPHSHSQSQSHSTGPSPAAVGIVAPSPVPAPGLGGVPLSLSKEGSEIELDENSSLGQEHGTPIMSPPPPQSPIKASSLGKEVTVDDVEMEEDGDAVGRANASQLA